MHGNCEGKKWRRAGVLMMALAIGRAVAASGPELKVEMRGDVQAPARNSNDWVALKQGAAVAPGERIRYRVELSNKGGQEARNAVALGPIPAGTQLVPGTATSGPGLKLDYSVDGGKTFSPTPTVVTTGKDGKPQTIPAPVERYTTVRWTWGTPLAAGAQASVSYQVQVR